MNQNITESIATIEELSNFRYNRVGGINADTVKDGETLETTLTQEQVKLVNADIAEFNKVEYEALVEKSELKAVGLSFGGVNISLNESNQNGLAAIKTAVDMAVKIGVDAFPLNFSAETKFGIESVSILSLDEFDSLFVQFFIARQQFFK